MEFLPVPNFSSVIRELSDHLIFLTYAILRIQFYLRPISIIYLHTIWNKKK